MPIASARAVLSPAEVAEGLGLPVGGLERARYRAVLLDEYQDTGHAQRVLLRALFGLDAGNYLATAEQAEDGLEPGEVDVATDRVQVLTVHAAKGLEWQVVALPNLVDKVFPAAKKSSSWLRSVVELPAALRGDAADLPVLRLEGCADRREVEQVLDAHEAAFDERRLVEERRLLYVALTRAEQTLLVSGHRWGETGALLVRR